MHSMKVDNSRETSNTRKGLCGVRESLPSSVPSVRSFLRGEPPHGAWVQAKISLGQGLFVLFALLSFQKKLQ